MKPKLYMKTTIPIYLASRPSRDLIIAGHQEITREWWEKRGQAFQIYISQLVVDEAGAGDPVAARERIRVLRDFPLLDIVPGAGVLASTTPEELMGEQNHAEGSRHPSLRQPGNDSAGLGTKLCRSCQRRS